MYTKTSWVARVGTALNRFLKTNETSTEVELTNDPTGVTTAGTPFTVANMNKIEQGIYDAHEALDANGISLATPRINQGVKTTDSPYFANMNPPILSPGDFDAPPQIGVGGFTFARSVTPTAHPTVTLPAIGTFICTITRYGDDGSRDCMVDMYTGGSVITGLSSITGGTLIALIHRIA